MQQLLTWTLDTIRQEEASFSWMEEYRYEWVPLVKSAVTQTVKGKVGLIITDESHQWFAKYILTSINSLEKKRPLLPFYSLNQLFPQFASLTLVEELQTLEDMLDISYPNGYYIWYIGKGDHPYTKLAYRNDGNFLWVMDEKVENSFMLRSADMLLDTKLIQLFKLFENTLFASIFGELDLEK